MRGPSPGTLHRPWICSNACRYASQYLVNSRQMPRKGQFSIVLTDEGRQHLQSLARQYTSPYCEAVVSSRAARLPGTRRSALKQIIHRPIRKPSACCAPTCVECGDLPIARHETDCVGNLGPNRGRLRPGRSPLLRVSTSPSAASRNRCRHRRPCKCFWPR